MRAIIRSSAAGSGQRRGEASASSRERVAFPGSSATPPTSAVNDHTSIPSSARKARATPPAATRAAVPDTGHDLGAVLLDRLASAAAVPLLPSREVDRQGVGRKRETSRDAFD